MGTQDVWLKPRTRVGWLQEVDIEKGEPNKEFDFRQVAVDEVEVKHWLRTRCEITLG